MCVYRQAIGLLLAVALSGCMSLDPTPWMYDQSPFSHSTQAQGNATCAPLFANGQFSRLDGKMPIHPGDIPTAAMLTLNVAPDPQDIVAIQALEGAARTCLSMREAAGVPTSASEDILQSRISKLRLALYRGDLPFAVYNYGVAQALKSHNRFLLEGEQAAAMGRRVGQDRESASLLLGSFMALSSALTAYDKSTAQAAKPPHWTCTTSAYPSGNTYVDCY